MKKFISSVVLASIFVLATSFGAGKTIKRSDPQFGIFLPQLGISSTEVAKLKVYPRPGNMAMVVAIAKKHGKKHGNKISFYKKNVIKAKLFDMRTLKPVTK